MSIDKIEKKRLCWRDWSALKMMNSARLSKSIQCSLQNKIVVMTELWNDVTKNSYLKRVPDSGSGIENSGKDTECFKSFSILFYRKISFVITIIYLVKKKL